MTKLDIWPRLTSSDPAWHQVINEDISVLVTEYFKFYEFVSSR